MAEQADLLNDAAKTGDAPAGDVKADAAKVDAKADAAKVDAKADVGKDAKADAGKDAKADVKVDDKKADAAVDYTGLKLAEGYKADDPVFADAVKLFGENEIAPDVAQKLIDFTQERDKAIGKAFADANAAAWTKTAGEWKATAAKENTPEQLAEAKTAVAKFFDKDTAALLESFRLTDHPGVIKAMRAIGAAIKDDAIVTGNAALSNGSDARKQFPNSNMNP